MLNIALIYIPTTTVMYPPNGYTFNWVNKTPENATFRHVRYYHDFENLLHTREQHVLPT